MCVSEHAVLRHLVGGPAHLSGLDQHLHHVHGALLTRQVHRCAPPLCAPPGHLDQGGGAPGAQALQQHLQVRTGAQLVALVAISGYRLIYVYHMDICIYTCGRWKRLLSYQYSSFNLHFLYFHNILNKNAKYYLFFFITINNKIIHLIIFQLHHCGWNECDDSESSMIVLGF